MHDILINTTQTTFNLPLYTFPQQSQSDGAKINQVLYYILDKYLHPSQVLQQFLFMKE